MDSRKERYLKALDIARKHGNKFMESNILKELAKISADDLDGPLPQTDQPNLMEQ
jgi:hypothetical protein